MNQIENLRRELANVPSSVLQIANDIVKREGAWVNDPADPGGATMYGVSLRYARSKGVLFDLDGDGDVDANDIRLVTRDIAAAMFVLDFYLGMRINLLDAGKTQTNVFDMCVNAGTAGIKILQRLVSTKDDGVVGPMTATATKRLIAQRGDATVNRLYSEARKAYYASIIAKNPNLAKFRNGWNNRANEMAR